VGGVQEHGSVAEAHAELRRVAVGGEGRQHGEGPRGGARARDGASTGASVGGHGGEAGVRYDERLDGSSDVRGHVDLPSHMRD
jgi:hypothetical protein